MLPLAWQRSPTRPSLINKISEPFKTSDGYNLIMVKEKREAVPRTFQQMKGSVLRKLKNEKLSTMYDDYTDKLRTTAQVALEEEKLAGIEVKPAARPSLGLPEGGLNLGPAKGKE